MYKFLIAVAIVVLGVYIGFMYLTEEKVDPRESINRSIEQVKKNKVLSPPEEQLLRLQLSVLGYIGAKGNPPESLNELVPTYFAAIPKDPATGEPYSYRREGGRYFIGRQATGETEVADGAAPGEEGKSPADQMPAEFVNPNTMLADTFIYDPTGRRDPFVPFDLSAKAEQRGDVPPLERYKLGQLRLAAVIADADGNLRGNVEDTQGKGYTVTIGTKVGDSGGVVVGVEKDRIKVLETTRDFAGNETSKVIELPIQKKAK